jgi:hypothetical protein
MNWVGHRGLWHQPEEANSLSALENAFARGYGIETDVRQSRGALFLAHDPITSKSVPSWEDFLSLWDRYPSRSVFLNIKEDGLLPALAPYLEKFNKRTIVCFDMSIPELVRYTKALPPAQVATRLSEWEEAPLSEKCEWIWFDHFLADRSLECFSKNRSRLGQKKIALVSPELHGRDPRAFHHAVSEFETRWEQPIYLCSDLLPWAVQT